MLGGRFITLIIDSIVYPTCVILCGILAVKKLIDTATFIAVLGGYALLVKETRKNYFDRTDRPQTEKGDENGKELSTSSNVISPISNPTSNGSNSGGNDGTANSIGVLKSTN